MKRIMYVTALLLVTSVLCLGTSCKSTKKQTAEVQHADVLLAADHSYLQEKDVGSSILVTGVVSGSEEKGFVLSENPNKRNKVTFVLVKEQSDSTAYKALSSVVGTTVTVQGVLVESKSPWSKKMTVVSVQK